MTEPTAVPNIDTLIGLFYDDPRLLGQFAETSVESLPPHVRRLLAHHEHMTVTVESFHGSQVDVEVLAKSFDGDFYARKILLRRQSDREVVQFGIVRLNLSMLDDEVRAEIEGQRIPLGRILIEHNVMRMVQLVALWRIHPGEELREHFGLGEPATCHGRTALIYCNGEPAVELLEIVTPD